ncbi:MAG: PD-(D/E)XK nuclease family protein [Prevotella sp.]|nr:PD-(D/E)XK nuclease family protein [Prevotella sp.]
MRVFFSFDYKGGIAYLGMKEQPMMMDIQVTDIGKLLDFLELRLGLHTIGKSETERLVGYYKCVRDYMKSHHDGSNKQLHGSYTVSPLATSREMLKWRDALAFYGWTKDTPTPSHRLEVLQGVELLFEEKGFPDVGIRLKNIVERLNQKKGMMKDVTFVMPYNMDFLNPVLKEIFSLAVVDGAQVEQIATPKVEGENNLAKLKRLLTTETTESIELGLEDDSVRIWNFKDDMEAEEYLAMMGDDDFDVTIQPDTKLTDNFLHMMGKPVTGSSVANSAPQIIQLFFTGVAMMARPLNIGALLQWLYAPIHPLPGGFRYRLAERLARTGGWVPNTERERGDDCFQLVQEWTEGKQEAEKGQPIDKKEQKARKHKVTVFLPDFNGGKEDKMPIEKLHTFLTELGAWSRQQSAIAIQEDQNDLRIAQLNKLAELCDTLKDLTDDMDSTGLLEFSEIEKHMACLYEPSEFKQYGAQATSRFTVSSPGQIAAKADKVLWAGLHDFEPMLPETNFLTPTEYDCLKHHLKLWEMDDVRKAQQQTLLLPLLFCQKQLTLVTMETVGGDIINKHPMIVRIEQQVKNHKKLTLRPRISADCYVPVEPLTNNATCGSNGLYAEISKSKLIKWREKESPSSLDKLMQNPLDYTLENIAKIRDNGQSILNNVAMTKGNVAHAVIQHLFLEPEDPESGYADAIKARVEAKYKSVFDKMVETKGAVLLLQENAIERRQMYEQLRDCIDHLIDIIEKDKLHVVECEMPLEGTMFEGPDDGMPDIYGFADMVLARENGQRIIFDFKWTVRKDHYKDLLKNNRSSQLAIYAKLLSEQTGDNSLPTAYFLMPRGRLFSTEEFNSYWATKVEVDEGCEGDIISKIVASYLYRRDEIMKGRIEMGEECLLEELDYFNDTEPCNLFPLMGDKTKEINAYSSYAHLKY